MSDMVTVGITPTHLVSNDVRAMRQFTVPVWQDAIQFLGVLPAQGLDDLLGLLIDLSACKHDARASCRRAGAGERDRGAVRRLLLLTCLPKLCRDVQLWGRVCPYGPRSV